MGKHCIVVIDMLNDFIGEKAALRCPGGERIVPDIKKLLDYGRMHPGDIHIVHIQEAHRKHDGDFRVRPRHAIKGTWGSEIIEELRPAGDEYVIQKRRHSGFMYTDLDLYLREEGIDTVVVTGIWTNVCVRNTASEASGRAYRVIAISDCCASEDEEMHRAGLRDMALFADIMTCEEYIADWKSKKEHWPGARQPDTEEKNYGC